MYTYCELDEKGYVKAVSQLSKEIDSPNMIQIDDEDFKHSPHLLGAKYENDKFVKANKVFEIEKGEWVELELKEGIEENGV